MATGRPGDNRLALLETRLAGKVWARVSNDCARAGFVGHRQRRDPGIARVVLLGWGPRWCVVDDKRFCQYDHRKLLQHEFLPSIRHSTRNIHSANRNVTAFQGDLRPLAARAPTARRASARVPQAHPPGTRRIGAGARPLASSQDRLACKTAASARLHT